MRVTLSEEQASELRGLAEVALREMSHEVAATDNSRYRAELIARRHRMQEAVKALSDGAEHHRSIPLDRDAAWTVEVLFTEDEDRTRADARLRAARHEWHGWGRASRNPIDPDIPTIGEELAAARALSDLSHQLVDTAALGIEAFEGHPVRMAR